MAHLESQSPAVGRTSSLAFRRAAAIALGAAAVALAARVAVPLPFSPVPMALSPLAVLVVGGVLGARGGAGALALYLGVGALGLPVFAAGGGVAYLLGPTGGYLLAFPVAAALVGALDVPGREVRTGLAALMGMAVIHLGGTAQLALILGDLGEAWRWGSLPFLPGDILKIAIAAVLIAGVSSRVRSFLASE